MMVWIVFNRDDSNGDDSYYNPIKEIIALFDSENKAIEFIKTIDKDKWNDPNLKYYGMEIQ